MILGRPKGTKIAKTDLLTKHKEICRRTGGRLTITPEAMERAMEGAVSKNTVVKRLMDETGCSKSAAYAALANGGRFGPNIDETPDGLLMWVA